MMMFRNSPWSRAFLAELSDYAHLGEDALLEMRPVRPSPVDPRTTTESCCCHIIPAVGTARKAASSAGLH